MERVWIPSPNYSSRGGAGVRLLVLHTAEGATTFRDLGHYFQGNVQASSHSGADDTPNAIGEYVKRENKAWHVAQYNPVAMGLEQCAFARWTRDEWMSHPHLLENTARWIAEEAGKFNIPIVKLNALQAQGVGRGVCQHRDLGVAGGGHTDCGDGFPIDYVLTLARGGPSPSPKPQLEAVDMIASAVSQSGSHHVFWVMPDKQTIRYRFQGSASTTWQDGGVFAHSTKDLAGISASRSATGVLELFAVDTDGNVYHTWQRPNASAWEGGEAGKKIASLEPLPGG